MVKLTIEEDGRRKAFIQYFDGTGADLADDLLISLSAFFTESDYQVLYHCVSETCAKNDITNEKITSIKAIELANLNAGIQEKIVVPVEKSEPKETLVPTPIQPQTPSRGFPWFLITLAIGGAVYMGFDYLQPYTAALMALVPTNPLLAFIACAGVFCAGWLIVSCLQYLTREREAPTLRFRETTVSAMPKDLASQKTLLNAFTKDNDNHELQNGEVNKKATAFLRSPGLN